MDKNIPENKKQDKRSRTNDQGALIQFLKDGELKKAWNCVKFIGIQTIPEYSMRYLIFHKAASKFDPEMNNNFIMFYKNYINFTYKNNRFASENLLTTNALLVNQIKRNLCSPQDDVPKLVQDYQNIII